VLYVLPRQLQKVKGSTYRFHHDLLISLRVTIKQESLRERKSWISDEFAILPLSSYETHLSIRTLDPERVKNLDLLISVGNLDVGREGDRGHGFGNLLVSRRREGTVKQTSRNER